VVEERPVMLPCRVTGVPAPVVRWTKDNVTVSPDDAHYRIIGLHWLAIPIVRCCVYIVSQTSCPRAVMLSWLQLVKWPVLVDDLRSSVGRRLQDNKSLFPVVNISDIVVNRHTDRQTSHRRS